MQQNEFKKKKKINDKWRFVYEKKNNFTIKILLVELASIFFSILYLFKKKNRKQ